MPPDGAEAPSGLELAPGVRVGPGVVDFSYSTSSGPGGQHVNRRSTRCTLRIRVEAIPISRGARARLAQAAGARLTADGELIIVADEHRSQRRNQQACLDRLRAMIVEARHVPKQRIDTRPGRGAIERRLREKRRRGEIKRGRQPPPPEER